MQRHERQRATSCFDGFWNMERPNIDYVLRMRPEEDEENVTGTKALTLLQAGEGRNEEESRQSQPGSGAAPAAELSGQDGPATGIAGFMSHLNLEGHDANHWENVRHLQQPDFWSMRGPWGVQPVPLLKGKRGLSNRFTRWQLRELELVFQGTQYISAGVRKRLALCLGVREAKVQNWFEKKRAQYRKYHNP